MVRDQEEAQPRQTRSRKTERPTLIGKGALKEDDSFIEYDRARSEFNDDRQSERTINANLRLTAPIPTIYGLCG